MESKFFYPINFIWLVGGHSIIEEVYYLRNSKTNFHINSINSIGTERLIKECEDENGDEYNLISLVNADANKMRLNTNMKINTKKMLDMLDDCGYEDSLKLDFLK